AGRQHRHRRGRALPRRRSHHRRRQLHDRRGEAARSRPHERLRLRAHPRSVFARSSLTYFTVNVTSLVSDTAPLATHVTRIFAVVVVGAVTSHENVLLVAP